MKQREIKFRDKTKKVFVDPKDYSIDGTRHCDQVGELLLDLDGKIRIAIFPCGNGDNSADSVFDPFPGPFVVQQYIGVKDMNDKEIYEGDILVRYATNVQQDRIDGTNIYHNRTDLPRLPFKDVIHAKGIVEYNEPRFELRKETSSESLCFYDGTPYEVIGNIFENSPSNQ
jgi:uncharacterized phage protein (TIGR01671 family)